jgi:hypothetical protein
MRQVPRGRASQEGPHPHKHFFPVANAARRWRAAVDRPTCQSTIWRWWLPQADISSLLMAYFPRSQRRQAVEGCNRSSDLPIHHLARVATASGHVESPDNPPFPVANAARRWRGAIDRPTCQSTIWRWWLPQADISSLLMAYFPRSQCRQAVEGCNRSSDLPIHHLAMVATAGGHVESADGLLSP